MSKVQSFTGNVINSNVNFGDGGGSGATTLKTPVMSVIKVLKDGTVEVDGKAVCKIPTTGATLVFEGDVQDVNLGSGSVTVKGNVYGNINVQTGSVNVAGKNREK
jgi:hypothetical protein